MTIIQINDITIGNNRRSLDSDKVSQLAQSIQEVGLLSPVVITRDNRLVAGHHRIAAFKQLGRTEIPFQYLEHQDKNRIRLAEIDENLMRNQGTQLEQAEWLAERKTIYETLYPETKAKIAGANASNAAQGNQSNASDKLSFASDTARAIGKSERTVQRKIKRATTIPQTIRDSIRDTEIADNGTELDLLADIAENNPVEAQAIVDTVKSGRADTVKEARGFHTFLGSKEQQFIDFILRHQVREMWRMERFYHWYENNHSEYSKFSAIEFGGVLHIDDNDNVEVLIVPLSEFLAAEARWAKTRQIMEVEAKKAAHEYERSQAAIQILEKVEIVDYVHGDCLALLPMLPDNSIRLLLTDPPYGVDFQSNRRTASAKADKITGDESPQDAAMLLQDMLRIAAAKMASDSRLLVFTSQAYYGLFRSIIVENGFTCGRTLTWIKENHTSGNLDDFAPQTEWIINAWRGKPTMNHRISEVLDYRRESHTSHPTEKPTQLLSELIKQLTLPDELVVDPFAGTGATIEAARRLGRKAYGIEKSKTWYDEGIVRLEGVQRKAA